jgi:ABC-2 type transport system ATP-binding protein
MTLHAPSASIAHPSRPGAEEPVVSATGLARRFGGVVAVAGIDVALHRGQLTALAGPDGAGKSTTIRMLAGLLRPDVGEVRVMGERLRPASTHARALIGYMPQQHALYGDLSVAENLRFFADLFGLDRATRMERTERLLSVTRLLPFQDRRADALSGGMYKKLAMACALLHQPAVLLLDEPSNGVDPVSRRELWLLLHEFVDSGMAVLVSTPYMDEAERCHQAIVLDRGRVLVQGSPTALARALPEMVFTLALQASGRTTRDRWEQSLQEQPGVVRVSPHGGGLRIIVSASDAPRLTAWVRERARTSPAELEPARAGFEDVYLSAVQSERPR